MSSRVENQPERLLLSGAEDTETSPVERQDVVNPETMEPVSRDGKAK